MESKAILSDVGRDFKTGKVRLTFTVDRITTEELDKLSGNELRLKATKWREKRSLDANAYMWVLCDKIASVLMTTKDEVYEMMLQDYGCYDTLEDGSYIVITLKSTLDISLLDGHYKRYRESDDGKFISYLKLKGSSEMDTKEMSDLINGVVYEAEQLGVETITPDEKERMLQQWQLNL